MYRMIGLWVGILCICSTSTLAYAASARTSYFKARRLYKQKKWKKAQVEFTKTLKLVKKLPSKTRSQKLFIQLGWCDIDYHLIQIDRQFGQKQRVCRQLQILVKRIQYVQEKWPRWRRRRINLLLPGRFKKAKSQFSTCTQVPTSVTLLNVPAKARISIRSTQTQSSTWKSVNASFKTLHTRIRVRVVATGYITREETVQVRPWNPIKVDFSLKKKPKPVVRKRVILVRIPPRRIIKPKRPLPPQPTPIYKQPWLWVTVGGVALLTGAAVTTAVVLSNQGKVQPVYRPGTSGCPFANCTTTKSQAYRSLGVQR